jgi:hypothetical protein
MIGLKYLERNKADVSLKREQHRRRDGPNIRETKVPTKPEVLSACFRNFPDVDFGNLCG